MGNLCSKHPSKADNDPFAQPGRVLGSTPSKPSQPRAQIPKTTTGGQKLGTSSPSTAPTASSQPQTLSSNSRTLSGDPSDPRAAAAKAAEERFARNNQGTGGKLGRELEKQRGMTRNDTLKEISETERRAREVEEGRKVRTYD